MAPEDRTAFSERLAVPWWAWPICLALAGGLAVEIGLGVPGMVTWLPLTVLPLITVGLLLWVGRIPVRVRDGAFAVDDARLPVEFIDRVEELSGIGLRDAMSVQLHPLAFVIQRPWVGAAVRVHLDDPDDPTPYWIVSTRRPALLARALRAEMDKTGPEPRAAAPNRS
ncbi:MAG TPA: DUF3093 domain-containing protein [Stackebrandtia sp.]|jgi:hypothetical protein|uniref:DUF3093 domain-containing protein n=1 Tax=Stackebrandtia sp. TaxID=2023065 RepID=UPI002D44712D|nr:DUF3093 domain-containing protein [Stackebrandtia sp.]HZE41845.1 DUF3093 domain-containing protein [Stackebrandtia sp.]